MFRKNFSMHFLRISRRKIRDNNFSTAANDDIVRSNKWIPVIGLEIHAQIACSSKLFSGASSDNFSPLNAAVSHFDCALPGTLPVLNRRCVEAAVLTCIALNCEINNVSRFDRKHYFYADLPTGYQITQQNHPIARNGYVDFYVYDPKLHPEPLKKTTKILQLQLEMDSGKSLIDIPNNRTLVDLNRAGCGLMEIVLDHNLHTGLEAACLVRELLTILRDLGTCEAKMEKGQFRVDTNISVRQTDDTKLGTRTEVKNLNSMRFVKKAVEYEVRRQIQLLEKGQKVINETRSFDFRTGATIPMRDKEVRQDYRYMPEPNLPPLHLFSKSRRPPLDFDSASIVDVDEIRERIPVLTKDRRRNWLVEYKLPLSLTLYIEGDEPSYKFFAACMNKFEGDAVFVYKKVIEVVKWISQEKKTNFSKVNLRPDFFVQLCSLLKDDVVTPQVFYKIIEIYLKEESMLEPSQIIKEKEINMITDEQIIESACKEILASEEAAVENYRKGKKVVLNRFTRLADQKLNGRVSMEKLEILFVKILSEQ